MVSILCRKFAVKKCINLIMKSVLQIFVIWILLQTDSGKWGLLFPLLLWTWWRHQMETFSALLAICAGNSPVPVNSPHKSQWRGALMFTLICARINGWVNNSEAGDLRRYRTHYDVILMKSVMMAHYTLLHLFIIITQSYVKILNIEHACKCKDILSSECLKCLSPVISFSIRFCL